MSNLPNRVPTPVNPSLTQLYNYIDIPEDKKPYEVKERKPLPQPVVEEDKTELTVEEFIAKYKNDPELRKMPLPESWYEKYNIPKPEILPLNAFLFKSIKACMSGGWNSEVRQADDKGVRKMPFLSTIEGVDLSGNPTTYLSTFTN